MLSNNNKISLRQIRILMLLDLFSTGVLVIPRVAAEYGQQDGAIIIALSTIIGLIYSIITTSLAKMFPDDSFVDFTEKITNRFIAVVLSLLFLIKLLIFASFELRTFGELTKQILLNNTPIEVIIIVMLLVAAYLGRKGYEIRARIGEFLIFLVFIPFLIVFALGIQEIKLSNIMPFFVSEPKQIIEGTYILSYKFSAVELMLLATFMVSNPKKSTKSIVFSVILVGILNVAVFFITVGTFGSIETTKHIWPVMTMMQVINIPNMFVERQDALMITFWILSIFIFLSGTIFFSSLLLQKIFKFRDHKYFVIPLVPIIYIITLIPDSVVETHEWVRFLYQKIGYLFVFIIPVILLIIAKVRKLGKYETKNKS